MMNNNGFNNSKSLSEQINEVVNMKATRREKVDMLIKLGIRENEISFVLPVEHRVSNPRFVYTFGVEIETYGSDTELFKTLAQDRGLSVYDHLSVYSGCHIDIQQYKLVPDGSISGYNPAECVTPVLNGNTTGFESLKECCLSLNEAGAKVNRSCGLHVHIGAANLTATQYVNTFKNYQKLERVIDSFMAESRRANHNSYCATLSDHDFGSCCSISDIANELDNDRYHKVNPMSWGRHMTIEFRQHHGTTNFTKIKNWVAFCAKLVAWSKNNVLTEEVRSIADIPFLSATEKRYFEKRANELNGVSEAA